MKYILIILLVIGIYAYAHVNRYQIFTIPDSRVLIKYDNWTDRTFILVYPRDNRWIELIELSKEEREKLNK